MVAVFTGNGLGLFDTSFSATGGGLSGAAARDRQGVNLATGNLVVQGLDELLNYRGMNLGTFHTYNSAGASTAGPDGWLGMESSVTVSGTYNTAGSKVTHRMHDGSVVEYLWNATRGLYETTAGDGAHDTFQWSSTNSMWIREDGSTLRREYYEQRPDLATEFRLHQIRETKHDSGDMARMVFRYDSAVHTRIIEIRTFRTNDNDEGNDAILFDYNGAGQVDKIWTREGGVPKLQATYAYDTAGRLEVVYHDLTVGTLTDNTWSATASANDGKLYRTQYVYDGTSMRIAAVIGSDGQRTDYTYDASGRVRTVTRPGGDTLTMTYGTGTTDVVDAHGRKWTYQYGNGRLTAVLGPVRDGLRDLTEYTYDPATGDLQSVETSRAGVTLARKAYSYDTRGNVLWEVDAEGNAIQRTWTSLNQLSTMRTYTGIDPDGIAGAAQPTGGQITRYFYDATGRQLRFVVGPLGDVTEMRYDTTAGSGALGQLSETRRYLGAVYAGTLDYTSINAWAATQQAAGSLTTFEYSALGRLTARNEFAAVNADGSGKSDAAMSRTLYLYDAQGLLLSQKVLHGADHPAGPGTGAATEAFDYVYDGLGRLLDVIRHDGGTTYVRGTTDATWLNPGDIGGATIPQSQAEYATDVTRTRYVDSAMSITTVNDANTTRTEVRDGAGRLVSVAESGHGVATRTAWNHYDAAGQLRVEVDFEGARTFHFYDERGNRVLTVDPLGNVSEIVVDALDRPVRTVRYAKPLAAATIAAWMTGSGATAVLALPPTANARPYDWSEGFGDTAMAMLDVSALDGTYAAGFRLEGGRLVVEKAEHPATAYPALKTLTNPAITTGMQYSMEVSTGASLSGTYLLISLQNTLGGAALRRGAVYFNGSNLYRHDNIGGTQANTLLGTLAVNTTYVVEAIATETGLDYRIYAKGQDRDNGFSFHVDVDASEWGAVQLQINGAMGVGMSGEPLYVDNLFYRRVRETTCDYDLAGRLVATSDGAATTRLEYDGAGRLVRTTVSAPGEADRVSRQFWDAGGRLIATLDAEGAFAYFTYDAGNRLTRTTRHGSSVTESLRANGTRDQIVADFSTRFPTGQPTDQITRYFHDARDRVIGELDAEGYLTESVFDEADHEVATRRYAKRLAPGGSKTFATLLGEAMTTPPAEPFQETRRAFDHLGRLASEVNHENTVTTFHYDHANRLTRTEIAAGTAEVRNGAQLFDAFGRLVGELDPTMTMVGSTPRLSDTMTYAQKLAVIDAYGTRHHYDAMGRRTESVDRLDNRTWYFHDAAGRVRHVLRGQMAGGLKNATAEVVETRYNAFGDVSETLAYTGTLPIGGTQTRTDAQTALATLTFSSSLDTRRLYFYDSRGLLIQQTDALSGVSTMRYNGFGELVSTTVPTTVAGSGVATSTTTTRTYDRRGQVVSETQGFGSAVARTLESEYDVFGRVVKAVDGRGLETVVAYDRLGRQVSTQRATYTGIVGAERLEKATATFDAFSRVLTQVNAQGQATSYAYGDAQRSVTVTTPDGLVTKTERTRHGETMKITAPGGGTTTYTYDLAGRVRTVTDPLGNVRTSEYDELGRLDATIDDAGTRIEYTFDAAGRVLTRKEDAGSGRLNLTTTWTYDGQGRVLTVVDAAGRTTTHKYDREGRTLEIARDPAGLNLITKYTWDAAGRQVKAAEYAGATALRATAYAFDALGRRTSETVELNGVDLVTSYVYDAADNVVATTDANGVAHYFAYDQANRLVYAMDTLSGPGDTTPTVAITRHWYDEAGRSVATRRYAATVTLSAQQALDLKSPTGQATLATLDTLTDGVKQDGKDAVEYRVHDAAGKLLCVLSQVGATKAYLREIRYDARGNPNYELTYPTARDITATQQDYLLMQGEIAAGTGVGSAWDRRVVTQGLINQVADAPRRRYGVFDEAGNERYVVVLNDAGTAGFVVERQYDEAGRVTAEIRHAKTVTPNAGATVALMQSQLGSATPDQMLVTRYVHDRAGRLRYTIDDAGYVTQQTVDGAGRVTELRQYTDAIAPAGWTEANVLAALTGKASVRVALNEYDTADRLKKVTDALGKFETYAYDIVANTTTHTDRTGKATVSTYDDAGRLLSVRDALGFTESFEVDGLGNRKKHTDKAGKVSTFEYDARGNLTKATDPLGYFETFTYDALGNRDSYTDKTRTATWNYEYDPLGRMTKELSPSVTVHRYTTLSGTAMLPEPKRIETKIAYDAFGNVVSRTENAGAGNVNEQRTTTYAYDSRGNQVRTTFPRAWEIDRTTLALADTLAATTLEVGYDTLGRAVMQKDTMGGYSWKVYDQLDRVLHDIDAEGYVTSYTYDAQGRQTHLVRRAAKLVANVPAGRDTGGTITDAQWNDAIGALPTVGDRTVVTTYDAIGRKSQVRTTAADIDYWTSTGVLAKGTPTTKFDYDAAGRVIRESVLIEKIGTVETYAETWHWYDATGNRTHTLDAENYLTKWTYDAAGREVARTEFANRYTGAKSFATAPADPVAGTAARGFDRTVTTGYDAAGRKTTETVFRRYQTITGTAASGNVVTTFEYDKEGRVVRTTVDDPTTSAPVVVSNAYDALGRTTGVTEQGRKVLKTSWQGDLGTLATTLDTEALYETITPYTRLDYDAFGNVVRTYRPGRGIAGTTAQSTAEDQTTYTRHDYQGRAVASTDAEGVTTYTHYNSADKATRVFYDLANGSGGTTKVVELMSYDRLGRQLERYVCHVVAGQDVAQGADAVAYNAFGEIVTKAWTAADLAQPNTIKTLDYVYDAAGRLIESDEAGTGRRYRYNLAGQQVAELRDSATSAQTRMELDKLGRAEKTHLPSHDKDGTTSTIEKDYDRWGNVLWEKDPRGGITERTYNESNQVLTQLAPTVAVMGADNLVTDQRPETRWWYDAQGRLIGVRDAAGNVDTNEYDTAGQLLKTTNSLVYSTRFAYDALGRQRVQQDARGYLTTQSYDRQNRVTGIGDYGLDDTGSARVAHDRETYVLDRNGKRISVENALEQRQLFDYDARGLLLRSRTATGAVMEYAYDYAGNRKSETYAVGTVLQDTQTWTYDIHGRLTDHKDLAGNDYDYGYDSAGLRRDEDATGIGLARDTTYYANGMVRRIQLSTSDYTEYEYDATGNRTREVTYKAATATAPLVHVDTRITYDSHGRIATIASTDFARLDGNQVVFEATYTYDAVGNRRKVHIESRYGPGEIETDSWYTYDAENRVVIGDGRFDGTTIKAYNGEMGRRNTAYLNTYDELGRVIRRTTQDAYGEEYADITEYSERGEVLRVYTQQAADTSTGFLLGRYDGSPLVQVSNRFDDAGRLIEAVSYFGPYETARVYSDEPGANSKDVRLHGVVKNAVQYTYDADGRLQTQVTWGRRSGTTKAPETNKYVYNDGTPGVVWAAEAFPEGTRNPVQYAWDPDTNLPGLTKLEEVLYTREAGVVGDRADDTSGYDAAGRLTTYRFVRHAPAWVQNQTLSAEDWATYTHTYTTTYLQRDSYLEDLTTGTSTNTRFKTSTTDATYDGAGRRVTLLDSTAIKDQDPLEARRSFVYNAEGQVLLRKSEHKDDGSWVQGKEEGSGQLQNRWTRFYTGTQWTALGETGRETLYRKMDNLRGIYVGGQQVASVTEAGTDLDAVGRMTDFSNSSLGRGMTQVAQGDTLKSISQRVYGTELMWYVLADANGLDENSELVAGTMLSTPQVKTSTNDSSTFKPYDPGEMTGPTSPSLPYIPPPDKGCGTIGMIIMMIVIIVVTIYTAGAAAGLLGVAGGAGATTMSVGMAAMAGTTTGLVATGGLAAVSMTGALMASAAIGAFVGTAVGTAVGSAMGVASFSWKKALASGAAAGLTAGIGGSNVIGKMAGDSQFMRGALTSVSNNLVGQATDRAFGIETTFSWKQIAVDAVSAGISSSVTPYILDGIDAIPGVDVSEGIGKFVGDFATEMTGGLVSAHISRAAGLSKRIDTAGIAASAFATASANAIVGMASKAEARANAIRRIADSRSTAVTGFEMQAAEIAADEGRSYRQREKALLALVDGTKPEDMLASTMLTPAAVAAINENRDASPFAMNASYVVPASPMMGELSADLDQARSSLIEALQQFSYNYAVQEGQKSENFGRETTLNQALIVIGAGIDSTWEGIKGLGELALNAITGVAKGQLYLAKTSAGIAYDIMTGDVEGLNRRVQENRESMINALGWAHDKAQAFSDGLDTLGAMMADRGVRRQLGKTFYEVFTNTSAETWLFGISGLVIETVATMGFSWVSRGAKGIRAAAAAMDVAFRPRRIPGVETVQKAIEVLGDVAAQYRCIAQVRNVAGDALDRGISDSVLRSANRFALRTSTNAEERLGLFYGYVRMQDQGWIEGPDIPKNGSGHGLDALFYRYDKNGALEYAVLEAKSGSKAPYSLGDTSIGKQGSRTYIDSQLRPLARGPQDPDALGPSFQDFYRASQAQKIKSFASFAGSDALFELPPSFGTPNAGRMTRTPWVSTRP